METIEETAEEIVEAPQAEEWLDPIARLDARINELRANIEVAERRAGGARAELQAVTAKLENLDMLMPVEEVEKLLLRQQALTLLAEASKTQGGPTIRRLEEELSMVRRSRDSCVGEYLAMAREKQQLELYLSQLNKKLAALAYIPERDWETPGGQQRTRLQGDKVPAEERLQHLNHKLDQARESMSRAGFIV